jgi:2',3'-cyclic-nucleotide 2'-phosphodiesterase (5'-nucleotidase family)
MQSRTIKYLLALALSAAQASSAGASEKRASGDLTLIHMGDLHGHLVPRPSVRSDARGKTEGGVARIYTLVDQIRRAHPGKTLLVNAGDTLHGSAEAMFTRGAAMVEVLNAFRIDAYAPGNWDYVYGTDKFVEYFIGPSAKANWNPVIANLYYDGDKGNEARSGEHVTKPYLIKSINGLRVGIIGFTSDRGPTAGDPKVTRGLKFTNGKEEYKKYAGEVREQNVDLVVVISELGLHGNLTLANQVPGVDIILSSDKHEFTEKPIRAKHGTLIVEQGMDGQAIGELGVRIEDGRVTDVKYTSHRIDERIEPDSVIAAMVAKVRKPFVSGQDFQPG